MNPFKRKDSHSDPHVSVLLDDACRPPFRPGSRIAGTVTIESPSQRTLNRAEAIFFGHARTHCTRTASMGTSYHRTAFFSTNETVKYHDDARLFQLSQNLCQTSRLEPNRTYTWRFDFTFPHTAALVGPSPWIGPTEHSGVYVTSKHLLPPTFAKEFNENHYALVEYTVQAVVHFSDNQHPITIQLPVLDFSPIPRSPESSTFVEFMRPSETISSSSLMDKKKSFRLSLREKASASNPAANLVIKASLNSQVVRSATFPIYTCVEIDAHSGGSASILEVFIKLKAVKLRQVTFFRARMYDGAGSPDEYQEVGEDSILLHVEPDHIVAQPQQNPSGDEKSIFFPATFDVRMPERTQPSFRTFNINHNFQLKVTLEAEVVGKKLEHKFLVENLTVLPSA